MAVAVIDPGHGGASGVGGSSPNNATGPGGAEEKVLTLAIGLKLRDVLAADGHSVAIEIDGDSQPERDGDVR